MSLIKKTEDSKYIAPILYSYFINSFNILNMFEISLGYSLKLFYQLKSPDDFIFHFITLFFKELLEVVLVENDSSMFLWFVHGKDLKGCLIVKLFIELFCEINFNNYSMILFAITTFNFSKFRTI